MNTQKLLSDCRAAGRVYIAGHKNPDADAVGACFALALAMDALGVEPAVLLEAYSDKFAFLAGNAYVCRGETESLSPEVLICLDCATAERLGSAERLVERAKTSYNIDHHAGNTLYANHNTVDPEKPSSCEMVYELIKETGAALTPDIAAALYTGIIGDTGIFRHPNCSAQTHIIAAELMRTGFDFSRVQRLTVYEHSLSEAKILGQAINGLHIVQDLRFAYACLSLAQLNAAGASGTDLDGIAEYLLNTRGVEAAALLSEREECVVYISLRSIRLSVRDIARQFGGGGHDMAAGYRSRAKMPDVLDSLISAVREAYNQNDAAE